MERICIVLGEGVFLCCTSGGSTDQIGGQDRISG